MYQCGTDVHVAYLAKSLACVWSVITTKWYERPVDTTAKEGDSVSLGRLLGTTKEAEYG